MPFITQGKTNWKFLLIVVILAAVMGGGIWLLSTTGCHNCRSRDAAIKANMSLLRAVAEIHYSTNEDSYIDFRNDAETIYIKKDIEKYGGTEFAINISPDGNHYCAEVKIPSPLSWFCIDDRGAYTSTDDNSICSSDYFSCEDETTDWQTYRNEKYNYEVSYPENYRIANSIMEKKAVEDETIREEYREEYSVEDLVVITNLSTEEEQEYLEICVDFYGGCYVETNLPAGTILLRPFLNADRDIEAEIKKYESLSDEEKYYVGFELSDFRIEKTTSGLEVRRWRLRLAAEYEMASIDLPEKVLYPPIYYGNTDYRYLDDITITMQIGDNYEKDLLVLDKVLSTFRFIEEGETADWQTYRNRECGFEIKYPEDWKMQEYRTGLEEYGIKERIYRIAFDPEAIYPPEEVAVDAPYGMVEIFFSRHKDFSPDEDKLVYIGVDQKIKAFYKEEKCQASLSSPIYSCDRSPEYFGLYYMLDKEKEFEFYPTILCSFFSDEEQKQYQNIFNQILSAFRFIEDKTLEIWDPICEREDTEKNFDVPVSAGDGLTNIARKAIGNYFNSLTLLNMPKESPGLSPEEKVYAEDYIVKNLPQKNIFPDTVFQVSCALTEEAVFKSRLLTIAQRGNLEQYSENVESFQVLKWVQEIVDEVSGSGDLKPLIIPVPK